MAARKDVLCNFFFFIPHVIIYSNIHRAHGETLHTSDYVQLYVATDGRTRHRFSYTRRRRNISAIKHTHTHSTQQQQQQNRRQANLRRDEQRLHDDDITYVRPTDQVLDFAAEKRTA